MTTGGSNVSLGDLWGGIGNGHRTGSQFSQAINTAGSAMVAQNIGARKHERVPKIMLTTFAMDSVIASIMALATWFYPNRSGHV